MKVRKGFVSNSSSTSYTCEICGVTESGWDSMSMEDFGFIMCENEHFHCGCELPEQEDNMFIENEDYGGDVLKEEYCPICTFDFSSKPDIKRYLYKQYHIEDAEVLIEIKKKNKRRRKVYDNDYVNYVYKKFNLQEEDLLQELKDKFKVYSKFIDYI